MSEILQVLVGVVVLAVVVLLWCEARRVVHTPIRLPSGCKLFAVLAVSGDGEGLEQTVAGLTRVLGEAAPAMRIVIEDCGLDAEGAAIARLLAKDNKRVIFDEIE